MRRRIGADEIIYEKTHAEAAELASAALPEVRRRTEELLGLTVPPVRVMMAGRLPPLWRYFRPTPALLGWFAGITAAVTCAAMGVARLVPSDYPVLLVVAGEALLLLAIRFRRYWAVLVPAGAVLMAAWDPRALPITAVLVAVVILVVTARGVQRIWPFAGGFALAWGGWIRPMIAVHWPLPERRPEVERLCYSIASLPLKLRHCLAHEYAHVALHLHYRGRPPIWLDEGFAFWLSEQLAGTPFWRPESRACVSEPEPARDARTRFAGQEWYYRLMARYYWEVRTLAEESRLAEVLTAPVTEVGRFRSALSQTVGAEAMKTGGVQEGDPR